MSNKQYERYLGKLIDDLFALADDQRLSVAEWADKAGLCYVTVQRINDRTTMLPRLKTVFAMAIAVGASLELISKLTAATLRKVG